MIYYFILIYTFFISPIAYSNNIFLDDIPIQDNGRVQPLDSFARNQLLVIHEKQSIKSYDMNSTNWIADLLIDPEISYNKKIFKIKSPQISSTLGLEWRKPSYYSYQEISDGINRNKEYFMELHSVPTDQYTVAEKQLSNLFLNTITYRNISRNFSGIIPQIKIENEEIALALDTKVGNYHSYAFIVFNFEKLIPLLNKSKDEQKSDLGLNMKKMILHLDDISKDGYAQLLKIIPPMSSSEGEWLSVWEILNKNNIDEEHQKIISILESYINAYNDMDYNKMDAIISEYQEKIQSISDINMKTIHRESWYNQSNLFYYSIALYLMTFLLIGIGWISNSYWINKLSILSIMTGFILHGYGIIVRMIIMNRPPVSTLYESIIFVGFISVLFSIIFELSRKDNMGILLGSIVGTALHFIGFGYASDGNTLQVLVAVLNSNFWLSTHVTTIAIGYGITAVSSVMGHIYLIAFIINRSTQTFLKKLNDNMLSINLIALFFMLFGTILGGIWADQSWGRFWGWDPKENAALLIVMWQLLMVHLKISGLIKPLGFAAGMVISNIFLAFGWFGVNLLGVGLHSYGFTDSIAVNLALFILFEMWFAVGLYFLIHDTIKVKR